ncbi:MAG: hypothetical protein QM638_21065 [Nocardioides sp.]|uniref:hypothetical protein n=1 Tax=Nocardioides sp. TaxID=35761 RepID=UPI0039E4EFFD
MSPEDLLLPEGSVLLHVGPYKTGSTTIQRSLAQARDRLEQYGAAYPHPPREPGWHVYHRAVRPGWAVLRWAPPGQPVPDISVWEEFAATVREQTATRVCVSTEDFGSMGNPERAQRIVDDLGGDNVYVVATSRALHRLLPSHWQERVKSALDPRTYDEWLRSVLLPEHREEAGKAFWRSHDLARTTAAWLAAVGPERFTLIVTDDSDRALLPHAFERMLGLPDGFLISAERSNESFSYNAAELVRRLNVESHKQPWPESTYVKLMRGGAFRGITGAEPSEFDERIPGLPQWALEPVRELGRQRVDLIEQRSLRVVGDPECLLLPADFQADTDAGPPAQISLNSAASALSGVIDRACRLEQDQIGTVKRLRARVERLEDPDRSLDGVSGKRLARELARRARARLRRPR